MLGRWDFHKSQNHGIPDWAEKDLEAHLIPLLAWGQVSSAEGSQGMLQPPTLVSPGRGWQGCGDHPSCIHQPITSSLQGGIVSAGIGVGSNTDIIPIRRLMSRAGGRSQPVTLGYSHQSSWEVEERVVELQGWPHSPPAPKGHQGWGQGVGTHCARSGHSSCVLLPQPDLCTHRAGFSL